MFTRYAKSLSVASVLALAALALPASSSALAQDMMDEAQEEMQEMADEVAGEMGADAEAPNTKPLQWDTFDNIDIDRSGYITEDEYTNFAFGQADWDNDGYLENTEWIRYTEVYFDPLEMEYDSYTYYDTDGDGDIDRTEFNEVVRSVLYDDWDVTDDALLDRSEWDRVKVQYSDPR